MTNIIIVLSWRAGFKEEVLYFNRWRIFTEFVIDQCRVRREARSLSHKYFTQRKQLKAVSSLLFHYIASFRSGRLVLGAESKRRNKIQKLMNKCNYLDLVKRKIHKSLILIDHEFVLS